MDRYIAAMLAKKGSERNPDISDASRAALKHEDATRRAGAMAVVLQEARQRLAQWPMARIHKYDAGMQPGRTKTVLMRIQAYKKRARRFFDMEAARG
jgi:hypothetical protein